MLTFGLEFGALHYTASASNLYNANWTWAALQLLFVFLFKCRRCGGGSGSTRSLHDAPPALNTNDKEETRGTDSKSNFKLSSQAPLNYFLLASIINTHLDNWSCGVATLIRPPRPQLTKTAAFYLAPVLRPSSSSFDCSSQMTRNLEK